MENYTKNPHHQEQNRKKSRKKSGSPSRTRAPSTPSQARASSRPSQQPIHATRKNTQQEQPRRNTQQVRAQQQTPRENTQQQQQRSQHKAHAKVVYRAYLSWVIMIVHAIAFVWMMFKVENTSHHYIMCAVKLFMHFVIGDGVVGLRRTHVWHAYR